MKRRLQVLALCMTVLLAVRLMAQDNGTGGGAMGGAAPAGGGADTSAGSSDGSTTGEPSLPAGGAGDQNGTGTGTGSGSTTAPGTGNPFGPGTGTTTTPGSSSLFGPATAPAATGAGSTIVPSPSPSSGGFPWEIAPTTGTAPSLYPSPSPSPYGQPKAAAAGGESAPTTLTLPGGYGGSAPKSFTLGEGRLAKPPITLSINVSQGYDDNIFSADAHPEPTASPAAAPTPPLEARIIGFRINPPTAPTPIFTFFRPKAGAAPTVAPTLGVVGSPVSTLSLGIQIQKGTPRTIVEMDASAGVSQYWNQPGQKVDYNGAFDLSMVHRLTPRATLSLDMNFVYQKTPDFSLINAPTNNGNGGDYLNGSLKADLTYNWTQRISTVSSIAIYPSLQQDNQSQNLYEITYGNQFRYAVSPRNTVTVELRGSDGVYTSNAAADTSSVFYLFGLDTIFSARLSNTFGAGVESHEFSSTGASKLLPYFESATTFAMPRGASLGWSNSYGAQESGSPTQSITSWRTSLSYGEPLSTRLVASCSVAYNYLTATDTVANSGGSYTQQQIQASLSLGYTVSKRLSLSLSYTFNDLLTSQINSSYVRDQVFLGGAYTFQ